MASSHRSNSRSGSSVPVDKWRWLWETGAKGTEDVRGSGGGRGGQRELGEDDVLRLQV